jgi:ribosomal protein RSM22 (predicted rRNA methylase)
MNLPASLRETIDAAFAHTPLERLAAAADSLSERYRAETRDGQAHLSDDMAALAYLAVRLPATYAAISAAFRAVAERRPDFAPRSLLDIGAGPATALLAAAQIWPLADALLIERSKPIRRWGERLAPFSQVQRIVWQDADLARGTLPQDKRDLVVIAYLLNELAPDARDRLVDASWAVAADLLVIVEPGTPAGWQRVLEVRTRLLDAGAYPIAPCPHAADCPLREPDWCHFARKVARSRLHRLVKTAKVPWEDEKFIYFAAARHPATVGAGRRVIAPPRRGSGRVSLKLCRDDGQAEEQLFTRRAGEAFRQARRLNWGDAWPALSDGVPAEQEP